MKDIMLSIDKLLFLIIFFVLIILGCASPVKKDVTIKDKVLLYKDISGEGYKLIMSDAEGKNNYVFDFNRVEQNKYLLYSNGTKILEFPHLGVHGNFYIYDIASQHKEFCQIVLPDAYRSSFNNYQSNDSILIFSNNSDIYIKEFKNFDKLDTVKLKATFIGTISHSNKNILAVLFNSDSSNLNEFGLLNSMQFTDFILIDLKSKERSKPSLVPEWIGNWSPDGKFLICRDSISTYLMEYPSLDVHPMQGLNQDTLQYYNLHFLTNDIIVFTGQTKSNPYDQIYLFDLNKDRVIKKITNSDSNKELVDVNYNK